ncbi:MAG: hypothetical protein ABIP39_12675, partial [Polyangiaceae bacterium]
MKLELPSRRVVEVELSSDAGVSDDNALFSAARRLFDRSTITDKKRVIDVRTMALGDFHVLRAIATKKGFLPEEPVEIACRNCEHAIVHSPCAALEIGPFLECALDDPELDASLDLGVGHAVPEL